MICKECKAYEHVIITDASLLSRKGFQKSMNDLKDCLEAIKFQRDNYKRDYYKTLKVCES